MNGDVPVIMPLGTQGIYVYKLYAILHFLLVPTVLEQSCLCIFLSVLDPPK